MLIEKLSDLYKTNFKKLFEKPTCSSEMSPDLHFTVVIGDFNVR